MKSTLSLVGLLSLAILQACSFAPDYKESEAPTMATAYKETNEWVESKPHDEFRRGEWWIAFHDPILNKLESDVTTANQNLKVAAAQYQEARAAASAARTAYFPVITGDFDGSRQGISHHLANNRPITTYNDFTAGADLSYEIDLWGRVRNTVAANEDQAQASAADLANVDLSLHAELASDYFNLRGDDEAETILLEIIKTYQHALELTQQRYQGGIVAEIDVSQAETQLENAKAQIADLHLQRAQLEHAIAILTGKVPADFSLAPTKICATLPALNTGLPATLLERRPDIAAAERRTAAANAEIGVARAAYFPALNLASTLGFESASLSNLITAPGLFWSVGPSAAVTLFDAGNLGFLSDEAHANYDAAVASYRQTVLTAYQQVEDNLAALHYLHDEVVAQNIASKAADRTLAHANNLYNGGATTYLDVVVDQNVALQAHLAATNTQARQLVAAVQLIRALGGGWQKADTKP